ncbi:hypothetical protein B0H16DRAFT_1801721 [Mycena metata]|uniref:Integrase core domain-containing protein n=1 Tax=Mycena metata TaxID=1033252 RepID=A0AAD7MG82_9AGAR|nr:hypothetical protein B0H16DRAFT_1801721 [Mycena metata]
MELYANQEQFPVPWIHSCARLSAELVVQLVSASDSSSAQEDSTIGNVTGLRTSTNNKAATVLSVFLDAVNTFRLPSRIEASIVPPSSGDQRLWVEVGSQFARRWRAFFYRLEALHGLDRTNPNHLWLLHRLFLDEINHDCAEFQAQWNAHPISGAGHDQSPNDMFLLGQLEKVMQRAPGETGAGQLDDEDVPTVLDPELNLDEEGWEDMIEGIETANAHHFHHKPVPIPKHDNPFSDEALHVFDTALAEAHRLHILPPGYGLLPEEWEGGTYPAFEILKSGRKGSKELRVALPDRLWRPRAERWGRALATLNELTYALEGLDLDSE